MNWVETEYLLVLATSQSHAEDFYTNQEVGYQAWCEKIELSFMA